MNTGKTTYPLSRGAQFGLKARAFVQLMKIRLSMLVVISALFGYLMAPNIVGFDGFMLLMLFLGGFFLTASANTLNQVIEIDTDKLMKRTSQRPLPTGVLNPVEAVVFALILGIGGVLILGYVFNLVAALLGIISLLSYAFVYTPLKRISSFSVMVGAIPGALPMMIGWAAATGGLEFGAWVLFLFQFFWQFPHFWAIAWMLDEDYRKAGLKMSPSNQGKSSYSASMILLYTTLLVPICLLPFWMGMLAWPAAVLLAIAGLGFVYKSWMLLREQSTKAARKLMFFSILYLPLIQIVMLVDKF